jgi:rhamnosyltransferase
VDVAPAHVTVAMAPPPLCSETTHAILVTYNPDDDLGRNLAAIRALVPQLVIVDNGSAPGCRARIREVAAAIGAQVIWNERNVGLATALNQGVRHARAHGAVWLLFFDQDSYPYPGLLERLGAAVDAARGRRAVGIVGCTYDDPALPAGGRAGVLPWEEVETVITAGSAIAAPVYDLLGPFRDDFFIDFIDVEYSLRARKNGFAVVRVAEPQMTHQVGRTTRHRLPWKVTGVSNHPPFRRYYAMRNHVAVIKQYAFVEPRWSMRSVLSRVKSVLLILLFEDERWPKLVHTARGLVDGLRGRMGPLAGRGTPA